MKKKRGQMTPEQASKRGKAGKWASPWHGKPFCDTPKAKVSQKAYNAEAERRKEKCN